MPRSSSAPACAPYYMACPPVARSPRHHHGTITTLIMSRAQASASGKRRPRGYPHPRKLLFDIGMNPFVHPLYFLSAYCTLQTTPSSAVLDRPFATVCGSRLPSRSPLPFSPLLFLHLCKDVHLQLRVHALTLLRCAVVKFRAKHPVKILDQRQLCRIVCIFFQKIIYDRRITQRCSCHCRAHRKTAPV